PLGEALRNYLRYRTEPESWMLGRFICPAARLSEFSAFREQIAASRTPLTVSALGRGGGSAQEFNAGVRADLEDIARFHEELAGRATVDVYETKLFASLFEPGHAKQLFALLGGTAFLIESHGPE